jgi:hypothetical protein
LRPKRSLWGFSALRSRKFRRMRSRGEVRRRPAIAPPAHILVEQLTSLGLEPGLGPQGWEQSVDLVSVTTTMPKVWTFERGDNRLSLSWWDQYIAGSGVQAASGVIDRAEVVFVGYGIEAPEYGWDDFKGRDLKGKVHVGR